VSRVSRRSRSAGLSQEETAELVGQPGTGPLVRDLQRRTQGNPLFLKELLRHPANRIERDGLTSGPAATLPDAGGAPAGIRDLVAQRVGRLAGDTRAIFDAAAVLGEGFELADVARLVGRRADAIDDEIDTLQKQGFFLPVEHSILGRQFTHPVVREAALTLLPPRRSQELHDKAIKCLEGAGGDEKTRRLPQLAYHAFASLPFGSSDGVGRGCGVEGGWVVTLLVVRNRQNPTT
jgi:predicted ATPase